MHPAAVRSPVATLDRLPPARKSSPVLTDRWAVLTAAVTGLVSCIALVTTSGDLLPIPGASLPTSWTLLANLDPRPRFAIAAVVEITAVSLLVLSWWALLRRRDQLGGGLTLGIAALWSAPLAIGLPLLSHDAYSYLAQGRLAALGFDPYRDGPARLGDSMRVQGVDPVWRGSRSPYGPLVTYIERGVALPGNAVVALVLLHLIALASLGAIAFVVTRLTARTHVTTVLLLTVANPLVLLQLLAAAHWEALLVALIALSVYAWRRGQFLLAIMAASAASAVKLPAFFAVVVLALLYVLAGETVWGKLRSLVAASFAAVAPWILLVMLVPDAMGFRRALLTPLSGRTLYAPTTLLAHGVAGLFDVLQLPLRFDAVLSICRVSGMLAALAICAWLLATVRRRTPAETIGLGLFAVAVLGPVLYPWYLTWGLIPLALTSRWLRTAIMGSTVAVFTALPGCTVLGYALVEIRPEQSAGIMLVITVVAAYGITMAKRPDSSAT
ncbi:MAG: alpha,6-mannosyltransferase [Frankiaceae bacterium]|nr:alpha,6-mannosyltransferase [Frankiaceae bacterium]